MHRVYKALWNEERFGYPVGGTRAIQLFPEYYLALFHSQRFSYYKAKVTYYMGAYIFSSSYPFEIVAMSRSPIVPAYDLYHNNFPDKAMGRNKIRDSDLPRYDNTNRILFPIGLERLNEEELIISLGYNDRSPYFLRLKISDLLLGMSWATVES
jgi:hypothetical protein